MKKSAIFLIFLSLIIINPALFAQNRYALVIGNADYARVDDRLPNAINDTLDIRNALVGLGYSVELKQNLRYFDMIDVIDSFLARLRNDRYSEGFFWYAGHAIEINGEQRLLPLDVDMNSEGRVRASSYSVKDLTSGLDMVRNRLNIIVLDACRVPPVIGGASRSFGDTSRVIKPIPLEQSDLVIFYSTASGTTASDGPGKRNSPFTEAFLKHINSTQPFVVMMSLVIGETLSLTNQNQRPFYYGSTPKEPLYTLNPASVSPAPVPAPVPAPQPTPIPAGLEYEIVNGSSVTITKYSGNAATVNIPEQINGLPVTEIGEFAFQGCSNLTNITLPSSLINIEFFAFSYCNNLTNITIPSSVTEIGDGILAGCLRLTNIDVDNRNPAYTSINGVLFDKNARTIIQFPAGKTGSYDIPSSVTVIKNHAFNNCNSITNISIPDSVTAIGSYAFNLCSGLTNIFIPSSVTVMGEGPLGFCERLLNINVDSRNPAYTSINGVLFDKNARTIIQFPAGKSGSYEIPSSVTTVGAYAFSACARLASVLIPSSVTTIEHYAFCSCSSLINISIPSSVATIGFGAFDGSYNLTNATLFKHTTLGSGAFPVTTTLNYLESAPIERPIPENFVRINSGTFIMGSHASEPGRLDGEGPQHWVTVGSFYIGRYEVTQREYQEVMGTNPSNFRGDNLPVECVSWFDAVEYCNRRSQREGLTPAYTISGSGDNRTVTWSRTANGYRLPTEAEWEYACRAENFNNFNMTTEMLNLVVASGDGPTPFNTRQNITTNQANYNGNYPYNNNAKGVYRERTTPVGSFAPNAWGLYDMHGNVFEWCWDWYGEYTNRTQTDPVGASSGVFRVFRGGSWDNYAQNVRSAYRIFSTPASRGEIIGFRLVRN